MRFLLLNQYYPPDPAPTGRMLHDVARVLASRGHDVRVLCSRRGYGQDARHAAAEERDGVRVRRLPATGFGRGAAWRRALDSATFAATLVPRLLAGPRPDLVVALTTPPFLGWIADAACRLRGLRLAHWVMDLYPDVLVAHGWLPAGGLAERVLAGIARRVTQRAALTLAIGPRMAEKAGPQVEWVPLWSEPVTTGARAWPDEPLVLLWTGNLGRAHRLDDFLAAADRLGDAGPLWVFAGQGPRRGELERVPRGRVRLLDSADAAAGDVMLAAIAPGWEGLVVPHKLQGAFAAGRPLLLVASGSSESAAWVRESGGGWVVEPGDVEGLLAAVAEARDRGERERRGEAARAYARCHFDAAANPVRIADRLEAAARS